MINTDLNLIIGMENLLKLGGFIEEETRNHIKEVWKANIAKIAVETRIDGMQIRREWSRIEQRIDLLLDRYDGETEYAMSVKILETIKLTCKEHRAENTPQRNRFLK